MCGETVSTPIRHFSLVISLILFVDFRRNFTGEIAKPIHRFFTGSPINNSPPRSHRQELDPGATRWQSLSNDHLESPTNWLRSLSSPLDLMCMNYRHVKKVKWYVAWSHTATYIAVSGNLSYFLTYLYVISCIYVGYRVEQCLGFCLSGSSPYAVKKSAVLKPKHFQTWDFPGALVVNSFDLKLCPSFCPKIGPPCEIE